MKPHVFIGSSTEGLAVAYAIQSNLDRDAEVTVWTQDVFHPSKFVMESLTDQLDKADVGIFVFSPDDVVKMRGVEHMTVRDNVIFEYGLYIGRLGRGRSFIVAPAGEPLHLPSDLLGMNYLTYQSNRTDKNLDAALAPASNKIRRILLTTHKDSEVSPPEFCLSLPERRDLLGSMQREILILFEHMESISFAELQKVYPDMSPGELSYRIEHLRLLMFIEPQKEAIDIVDQTFQATEFYRQYCLKRFSYVKNNLFCKTSATETKSVLSWINLNKK